MLMVVSPRRKDSRENAPLPTLAPPFFCSTTALNLLWKLPALLDGCSKVSPLHAGPFHPLSRSSGPAAKGLSRLKRAW